MQGYCDAPREALEAVGGGRPRRREVHFKKFTLSLVVAAFVASGAHAVQVWKIVGGNTSISFLEPLMNDLGIGLKGLRSTAEATHPGENGVGFEILERSTFTFETERGVFRGFVGGGLQHTGGFTIGNAKTGRTEGFEIVANGKMRELGLTLLGSNGSRVKMVLANVGIRFDRLARRILIPDADLLISPEWAQAMGRPDLADQLVGTISIDGIAIRVGGPEDDGMWFGDGGGGDALDLGQSAMASLVSLGRLGTYPNGTNGLSMATTSCNYGTVNINWFAPMDVRHPVIAFNIYRIENGRIEQISDSWLKHGFFALNDPGCGTCQDPGTGTLLGPGCSDVYGTGNNGDRRYLGPRDEVNPFTGVWTCTGSWFSNYVNDCTRRNTGSGLDAVAHRIIVKDGDLGHANATYLYESYYITAGGDINKYNQIGSRTFTGNWTGTQWSFTTTGSMVMGPAIQRWGDENAFAEPRGEGDVIVAVDATDLGTGMWRYNYAVYVHDLDRQIDEFVVPIVDGSTVTNAGFRDPDDNAGNDWTLELLPGCGQIRWFTTTNPLKYATTFNFWFETSQAPVQALARLDQFKAGALGRLASAINGPLGYSFVDTHSVLRGAYLGGVTRDLECSDDVDLTVGRGITFGTLDAPIQVELLGQAPGESPAELRFKLEAAANSSGLTQEILLWDYPGGTWVLVDQRAATVTDSVTDVVLSSNIARFIQAGTRQMKALVRFRPTGPLTIANFSVGLDRAVWTVVQP